MNLAIAKLKTPGPLKIIFDGHPTETRRCYENTFFILAIKLKFQETMESNLFVQYRVTLQMI